MSLLGRRVERNEDWSKSDRNLATAAPILLVLDSLAALGAAAAQGGAGAVAILVSLVVYIAVVLAALWSGLPAVALPPPAPKESAYRPGPRVEAIAPPKPSYAFMRIMLGLVVGAHLLAVVAAVAFAVLALVVLGLLWAICSKH